LPGHHLAGLSLFQRLADTRDDFEPLGKGVGRFLAHEVVGFGQQASPFGVPQNDPLQSQVQQVFRGDLKTTKTSVMTRSEICACLIIE
jgi:hypothetical protein